jgi:hypothetical protein
MRIPSRVRPAIGVPLIAAGVLAAAAMTSTPPVHRNARECAAFMDDSIPPGSDRVESIVKVSEPTGDSLSASFPKESGIAVILAKRMSSDDPLSAHIVLNTVRAVPGQWKLTLVGNQNTCTGGVYVGKKKA